MVSSDGSGWVPWIEKHKAHVSKVGVSRNETARCYSLKIVTQNSTSF